MLGGGFGGAGVDFSRKLIGIGDNRFLEGTVEEMQHLIGHEVAHIWRRNNPGVRGPQAGSYAQVTPRQQEEIEADLLGACLAQNKEAAVRRFEDPNAKRAAGPGGLPLELRVEALKAFDLALCSQWVEWNLDEPVTPDSTGLKDTRKKANNQRPSSLNEGR